MRPVITVIGRNDDLLNLTNALIFALSGKRLSSMSNVWLDAADDAGNVWTIERSPKGSIFRRNSELLALEEAQQSLLASLLDLDVSLNRIEGLVAPVELRQIVARGHDLAATTWDPSNTQQQLENASVIVARKLAESLASKFKIPQFSDPFKLAVLAESASTIYGAMRELQYQEALQLKAKGHPPELDGMFEQELTEIELLNQIDLQVRRINEGGEPLSKMLALRESLDQRTKSMEAKWGRETLQLCAAMSDSEQLLEKRIRVKAWGRIVDSLQKLQAVADNQVQPAAVSGLNLWSDFLTGTNSHGQDMESCLASMLLGVKQLSADVDRVMAKADQAEQREVERNGPSRDRLGWFERFRSSSTQMVDSQHVGLHPFNLQRNWLVELARDIENLRATTEFALQSSQVLVDKIAIGKNEMEAEWTRLNDVLDLTRKEYDKLQIEWCELAAQVKIDAQINVEWLTSLLIDVCKYQLGTEAVRDLQMRLDERQAVRDHLEKLIRSWWELNGSQKSSDLSNQSFLVAEAKAALRYRDGRRARVKKYIREAAAAMVTESTTNWIAGRQAKNVAAWTDLFAHAGLPVPPLDSGDLDLLALLVSTASRCEALLTVAELQDQEQFSVASLWPSRLDSAVVVYRWMDEVIPLPLRHSFLKSLNLFTGNGGVPVFLLVNDVELANQLVEAGTGTSTVVEVATTAVAEAPRREGGVVKSEPKIKQKVKEKESILSPRAHAALSLLNPKATK